MVDGCPIAEKTGLVVVRPKASLDGDGDRETVASGMIYGVLPGPRSTGFGTQTGEGGQVEPKIDFVVSGRETAAVTANPPSAIGVLLKGDMHTADVPAMRGEPPGAPVSMPVGAGCAATNITAFLRGFVGALSSGHC